MSGRPPRTPVCTRVVSPASSPIFAVPIGKASLMEAMQSQTIAELTQLGYLFQFFTGIAQIISLHSTGDPRGRNETVVHGRMCRERSVRQTTAVLNFFHNFHPVIEKLLMWPTTDFAKSEAKTSSMTAAPTCDHRYERSLHDCHKQFAHLYSCHPP
jgi:hypothetical protein